MQRLKNFSIGLLLIFTFVCAIACDSGDRPLTCQDGYCTVEGPSGNGVASSFWFYPPDAKTTGTYDAVTLSGGMTNTKEQMEWLAVHLARNGYIVLDITASNNMLVAGYIAAHNGAVDMLQEERANGELNIDDIGIIGFSMGGGAVMTVGGDLQDELKAVVALAPWNPVLSRVANMTAATLVLTGANDNLAQPEGYSTNGYEALPSNIDRAFALIDDFTHADYFLFKTFIPEGKTDSPLIMVKAWLDFAFEGIRGSVLDNPPADVHYQEKDF